MGVFYDQSDEYMHMNLPKEEIMYDEIQFLTEFTLSNVERKSIIHINKW